MTEYNYTNELIGDIIKYQKNQLELEKLLVKIQEKMRYFYVNEMLEQTAIWNRHEKDLIEQIVSLNNEIAILKNDSNTKTN